MSETDHIAATLLKRRDDLLERRKHLLECLNGVQSQMAENGRELSDCVTAGRVFGVEIILPFGKQGTGRPPAAMTIKALVLRRLSATTPFRVAEHREEIEREYGRPAHAKSIGVALYRLLQEGRVRRSGRCWYLNE